jgi:small GTP-binding protein
MKVVIAGRPNAGKSSLLNALAGREAAIVTDIAGTTRDVLREHIHIDGMPLHIIDTAGLRETGDAVEKIGISRAWEEINQADLVLLMIDSTQSQAEDFQTEWADFLAKLPEKMPVTLIRNKVDLSGEQEGISEENGFKPPPVRIEVHSACEHSTEDVGHEVAYAVFRIILDCMEPHLEAHLICAAEQGHAADSGINSTPTEIFHYAVNPVVVKAIVIGAVAVLVDVIRRGMALCASLSVPVLDNNGVAVLVELQRSPRLSEEVIHIHIL